MILGIITDIHIYDQTSLQDTVAYLKAHLQQQKPDLMICLGDIFDKVTTFIALGQTFKEECYKVFPHWVFVYGNHDGEYPANNENQGWEHFLKVFPNAQSRTVFQNQGFVSVADMEEHSNFEDFLRNTVQTGDIVLSHGPFHLELLDELDSKGVRLALNGHTHVFYIQQSSNERLKQYSLPCFRIGGMDGNPACLSYVTLENGMHSIICQETPLPSAKKLESPFRRFPYPKNVPNAKTTLSHLWSLTPPIHEGDYQWQGGYSNLKCYKDNILLWEKSYGVSHFDTTPLYKFQHQNQTLILVSGTWGKQIGQKDFTSSVLIDALSGEPLLYLPVIGVSAEPYIDGDEMFIAGQWHEVLAIHLTKKSILWVNNSFVSHPNLEWRDNRNGGGWCTNKPIANQHVWVVNARGDVIGYNRHTGARCFIHVGYIKGNQPVPYSPTRACANLKMNFTDSSKTIIQIDENCYINDLTGEKIKKDF